MSLRNPHWRPSPLHKPKMVLDALDRAIQTLCVGKKMAGKTDAVREFQMSIEDCLVAREWQSRAIRVMENAAMRDARKK